MSAYFFIFCEPCSSMMHLLKMFSMPFSIFPLLFLQIHIDSNQQYYQIQEHTWYWDMIFIRVLLKDI
jgi:hypothetical protein